MHLCTPGTVIMFIYRDLLPNNEEHEIGIVTKADIDYFEVCWHILYSTSGCNGLNFYDWYSRGERPDYAWKRLTARRGKIFDTIDENCDLGWSSTLISR